MLTRDTPQLQLQQVSLATPSGLVQILHNLSFTACVGDRVGLVGASGSGKTSLLRLLNRLSDPSSGVILLAGQKLEQIPVLQLRQQVVLVLQETKLLGMTVRDTLIYPLKLRGLPQSVIQQRFQEWTARFEIPQQWLTQGELQLSVGQRQWVGLARAFMSQPQILLLDEPTSALDLGRIEQLLRILTECQQTIFLASHQLELVERFCQSAIAPQGQGRLLWLEQGQLVQYRLASEVNWSKLRQTIQQQEQARVSDEWN